MTSDSPFVRFSVEVAHLNCSGKAFHKISECVYENVLPEAICEPRWMILDDVASLLVC